MGSPLPPWALNQEARSTWITSVIPQIPKLSSLCGHPGRWKHLGVNLPCRKAPRGLLLSSCRPCGPSGRTSLLLHRGQASATGASHRCFSSSPSGVQSREPLHGSWPIHHPAGAGKVAGTARATAVTQGGSSSGPRMGVPAALSRGPWAQSMHLLCTQQSAKRWAGKAGWVGLPARRGGGDPGQNHAAEPRRQNLHTGKAFHAGDAHTRHCWVERRRGLGLQEGER